MSWTHNTHNKTRESPRYIFTIFTIILSFFLIKKIKSSIIPLIFTFITYYFAKKKTLFFFFSKLHIYIFFIIFWLFFFFFSLTLYFWNSKLYSRFLIYAFWYLISILYLYFLYNFCDIVRICLFVFSLYFSSSSSSFFF